MPPDGRTTPQDCARWQFEIWPTPGLAEESRSWSKEKRDAFERMTTPLALASIWSHLLCELTSGDVAIPTQEGCVHCSINVVGNKIRITVSKFHFVDPDDPGPDGGHVCAPVDGLALVVYGIGRSFRVFELHGELSIPDDVTRNRDVTGIEYIAARFTGTANCDEHVRAALIPAFSAGNIIFQNEGETLVAMDFAKSFETSYDEIAQARHLPHFGSLSSHNKTLANLLDESMASVSFGGLVFGVPSNRLAGVWNYDFAIPLRIPSLSTPEMSSHTLH
jgi:hypothetical protein